MCGISGFIGLSKDPVISEHIITNLVDFSELRGIDASGVWATEPGKEGCIFYHKEPIKSSQFINTKFWSKIFEKDINLFIAHARFTSKGGGSPNKNINNHPFVSSNRQIAMVHNGSLDEEVDFLSKKYELKSETDSEIILRMFENGIENYTSFNCVPDRIARLLGGVKNIWSNITKGAMAVAIGEREDDSYRNLLLFRNEKRPLWIVDLRDSLGQIFFFSSPDIWYQANSKTDRNYIKNQKLIEIPPNEAWIFSIRENQYFTCDQFYRFEIKVKETGKNWEENEFVSIQTSKIKIKVVTDLTLSDEMKKKPKKKEDIVCNNAYDAYNPRYTHGGTAHESLCDDIIKLTQDIKTSVTNSCLENSLDTNEYQDMLRFLAEVKVDLNDAFNLVK